MHCVLTVDGVPVGRVVLAPRERTSAFIEPFPAFAETGLAAAATRAGEALRLSHGPSARPCPRQRRLRLAARLERRHWELRLGLLDDRGVQMAAARLGVITLGGRMFLIADFRASLALMGARLVQPPAFDRARARPAA